MLRLLLISCLFSFSAHSEVEVMHWWTAKGEKLAFSLLEKTLDEAGIGWTSSAVTGGGGDSAMRVLQTRAIAGNPPGMVQMEGQTIQSWAALGFLSPVDELAKQQQWAKVLPEIVQQVNQYQGQYVAVPLTIHRTNWLWANKVLLGKHNLSVPDNWPELIRVMKQLKQKGIRPLALGDDAWQVAMLFENLALAVGGKNYYQSAFRDLSAAALASPQTLEALRLFRQISGLVEEAGSYASWERGSEALAKGEVVFQFSGDWVLGELQALKARVPEQIACLPMPGTRDYFTYNMDSFVFFAQSSQDDSQFSKLTKLLSAPEFVKDFNRLKGSLPARQDINLDGYNACSIQAKTDFEQAQENQNLLPSLTDSMSVSPVMQSAIVHELHRYFFNPSVTPEQVVTHLVGLSQSPYLSH